MVTAGLYTLNRVGQDKSPTGGSVSILKKFGYRMFRCTKPHVFVGLFVLCLAAAALCGVCAIRGHAPAAVCTVYRFFPRCQRCRLHELAFLWNFACMRTVDKPAWGDYNNRDFGYERWRLCSRNRHRLFYSLVCPLCAHKRAQKYGAAAGERPRGRQFVFHKETEWHNTMAKYVIKRVVMGIFST